MTCCQSGAVSSVSLRSGRRPPAPTNLSEVCSRAVVSALVSLELHGENTHCSELIQCEGVKDKLAAITQHKPKISPVCRNAFSSKRRPPVALHQLLLIHLKAKLQELHSAVQYRHAKLLYVGLISFNKQLTFQLLHFLLSTYVKNNLKDFTSSTISCFLTHLVQCFYSQ